MLRPAPLFASSCLALALCAHAALAGDAKDSTRGVPADAPRLDLTPVYFQGTRVAIDGDFHDWSQVASVHTEALTAGEHEYDWTGPADLSADVAVQHNDESLFVYVNVRDNAFKPPEKGQGADTVDLWFDLGEGAGKDRYVQLRIDPTWAIGQQALEVEWRHPKSMKKRDTSSIGTAATINPDGYELEVELPFTALSDAPPLFEPLGFCVVVNDWDHDDKREEQASVSTCPFDFRKARAHRGEDMGQMRFETRDSIWRGIKSNLPEAEAGASHSVMADVGGDGRREEVAIAGGRLLVLGLGLGPGEWYAFNLGLGVDGEVIDLKTANVTGDGHEEMLVTVRRRWQVNGQDVEQDVTTVFGFVDEMGISDPLAAVEVRNAMADGSASVTNELSISKKGITQKRGEAVGWDESTYVDADNGFPENYAPLLLPWEKKKSAKVQF